MHAEQTITILKALADPTRLEIVRQLAYQAEGTPCSKVRSESSLSQPTVSHHVGKLVEAGLVHEYKVGKEKVYELNKDAFRDHGLDPTKL